MTTWFFKVAKKVEKICCMYDHSKTRVAKNCSVNSMALISLVQKSDKFMFKLSLILVHFCFHFCFIFVFKEAQKRSVSVQV